MKSYEKEYRHCLENSNKMELVDKIIYDEKEIERLKEEYIILQNASDEVEEELQQRINNAIEYIKQQRLHKFQDTTGGLTYAEWELLKILKGIDKE